MTSAPGFSTDELKQEQSMKLAKTAPAAMVVSERRRFTPEQRDLILRTCCGGASPSDAEALIAIAEERGMNPIAGECYFVERWDSQKGRKVWAVQASIDSFRIKAEETGLYDGQDEPEFEHDASGKPTLARVRVYRKDWSRPAVGVARYDEYVQTTKDGGPTKFWKQMPHNQLAKCAEALALRKGFPTRFAGIYTQDEMAQAQNGAPSHDEMTGEVVERPKRDSTPPALSAAVKPGRASPEQAAEAMDLERALVACGTVDQLKAAWADVVAAAKVGRIAMAQRNELAKVKDQQKAMLDAAEKARLDAEEERANDVGEDPAGLGP